MTSYCEKYEHLFEPLVIGKTTFKNRIFSAPTSLNWGAVDGNLTLDTIGYYERKAQGGCAVVTMGESITHSKTGKSHDRQVELDNPTSMVGLAQLARAIKRHGAIPSAELSHGGKWGGLVSMAGALKDGKVAYGASPETLPQGQVYEMPRDLIFEIADSFGKGAATLQRAGFEMCTVHAGHGWLFGQFLSNRTNHRTDEFGGSMENRARFLIMALDAIRKAVGPDFLIDVRISGDEFTKGGITQEEGIALAKMIQDKCDIINVSAGLHEDMELYLRTHPSQYAPKGPNVYLAEAIRKEVHTKISTVGAIPDPELMEEIIATGKADIVELGRALLADPDFPKKLRDGREKEIRRCLRCMGCYGESVTTENSSCAINPIIGNEYNAQHAENRPTTKKKVMVVGGGPGGMEAAITAAERGHDVVLYEKSGKLGGALNFAEKVDFKRALFEYAKTQEYIMGKRGVKVNLNADVTRDTVEAEKPDVLFIATGAHSIVPKIDGVDRPNVFQAEVTYGKENELGENIVVLGGGLVGCETAAHLAREGKNVTLVEMRGDIALDADIFYQAAVRFELRDRNVKLVLNASGEQITEEGLVVKNADGQTELLKADNVLCAVGYRPDSSLYRELHDAAPVVEMIGDCRRPGKVKNAVADAYYLALDI